ncbi:MAG: acyl carrier protein, partial [bacterium]
MLSTPPEALRADLPLASMGLDSLMAVDLKNHLEQRLPVGVPVLRLLRGPSIDELAQGLAAELEARAAAESAAAAAKDLMDRVDELDEGEMDALLAELMEEGAR